MDKNDLRRLSRNTGFDVVALEKDYALTWLLSGIYAKDSPLRDILIFKGGTAIRKVYFREWRLSEDLDFTIVAKTGPEELKTRFLDVFQSLNDMAGIKFSFGDFDGTEYRVFADVRFVGPLQHKNRIAHDISLTEKMVEEPVRIKIKPEYEDVPGFEILAYSLNEIVVEKIRSMLQRVRARDYYDVWRLMKEKRPDPDLVKNLLIRKCEITGIEFRPELIFDESRAAEAKKFWGIALSRLTKDLPDFDKMNSELKDRLAFLKK